MDCQEVYKLMNHYIDNEITPEEEKVLEFHLGRCKACQKEFSQLKEMCTTMSTMQPSHDFTTKVMGRIQKEKKSRKRWVPKTYVGWATAAAAVLLCFILIAPLWGSRADSELIISSGKVQSVPGDQGQDLTVVDGEIRVKGHNGVLTAINSKIIFEGTKADLNKGLWDQIVDGVNQIFEKIQSWFSGAKDIGEPVIE
jgi:hypothetical protein